MLFNSIPHNKLYSYTLIFESLEASIKILLFSLKFENHLSDILCDLSMPYIRHDIVFLSHSEDYRLSDKMHGEYQFDSLFHSISCISPLR